MRMVAQKLGRRAAVATLAAAFLFVAAARAQPAGTMRDELAAGSCVVAIDNPGETIGLTGLFASMYSAQMTAEVGKAFVAALRKEGIEVVVPPGWPSRTTAEGRREIAQRQGARSCTHLLEVGTSGEMLKSLVVDIRVERMSTVADPAPGSVSLGPLLYERRRQHALVGREATFAVDGEGAAAAMEMLQAPPLR